MTKQRVATGVLFALILLYCAFQPQYYRSHETGGRVITVQLPTVRGIHGIPVIRAGEAGYNNSFFYCQKGTC